jgi:hypothetical protein
MSQLHWKIAAALVLLSSSPTFASCGSWVNRDKANAFAARPTGTLALVDSSGYYVFARGNCVNLRYFNDLYFQINHNNAVATQPTFVSVQVALVKFKGPANVSVSAPTAQQYLYRNIGPWNKDRSGLRYRSTHQTPHTTFNQQLLGEQSAFDQQYRDDTNRSWNDSVDTTTSPPLRFETWRYGSTFSVRQDLTDAIQRGEISVFTQNYLVSFTARAKTSNATDLGSPPDFSISASGYDCGMVRIAGTSAFSEFDGEYMINRAGNNGACNALITRFGSVDLLSWLR